MNDVRRVARGESLEVFFVLVAFQLHAPIVIALWCRYARTHTRVPCAMCARVMRDTRGRGDDRIARCSLVVRATGRRLET